MIKIVLTDSDGCLTDGKVSVSSNGTKSKTFNYKDGVGFLLLAKNNIKTGIITCDTSTAILDIRFRRLNLDFIIDSIPQDGKKKTIDSILNKCKLKWNELAYLGDDLPDLETMEACGMSFCPSDASDSILRNSKHVCRKRGGEGVFREVCDIILNGEQRI